MKSFVLAFIAAAVTAQEGPGPEGGEDGGKTMMPCESTADCQDPTLECCATAKDGSLACLLLEPPADAPEDMPPPMCIEDQEDAASYVYASVATLAAVATILQ